MAEQVLDHAFEEPKAGEGFPAFTVDGGWCWFADPRAVYREGRLFTGWVDSRGSVVLGALDTRTGALERHVLHDALERDDHDNPTFEFHPDGRLMVFYSRHGKDDMYVVDAVNPGEISAWHPPRRITLNSREVNAHVYSGGVDRYTYPSPYRLGDEGGRLYLFWRGLDNKPNLSISDDDGRSWSPGRIVIFPRETYLNQRPYTKYHTNGSDRIHVAFTDGHPRNEPTNSIYYACYRDGAFYRADGSLIKRLAELPFDAREAHVVYDARLTGHKAWVWEVAEDAAGHPVIVYVRFPTDEDHRYYYARWDGSRWHDRELTGTGRWFPNTPPGETEREPNYSPGIALDRANPDVVYLSRRVNGILEIERWHTRDGGATWESTPVTAGSKNDNIRPYVVNAGETSYLLWLNVERYRHYTDYLCSLRFTALPGAAG